jgi:hypothetical protein
VKRKFALNDLRRDDRFRVLFLARLREYGHTAMEVQVTNLAANGFCCRASFTMREKSRVWLTIPGLEQLEAKVIWVDGFYFGSEFKRPLHPAVFDHVSRNFGFFDRLR